MKYWSHLLSHSQYLCVLLLPIILCFYFSDIVFGEFRIWFHYIWMCIKIVMTFVIFICSMIQCFCRSFGSHVVGVYFAWFLLHLVNHGYIYNFGLACFIWLSRYEHVWDPKLVKGGGFIVFSGLSTTFTNFSTLFSSIFCYYLLHDFRVACYLIPGKLPS